MDRASGSEVRFRGKLHIIRLHGWKELIRTLLLDGKLSDGRLRDSGVANSGSGQLPLEIRLLLRGVNLDTDSVEGRGDEHDSDPVFTNRGQRIGADVLKLLAAGIGIQVDGSGLADNLVGSVLTRGSRDTVLNE